MKNQTNVMSDVKESVTSKSKEVTELKSDTRSKDEL